MLDILSTAKGYQVVETAMQLISDRGVLNYSLTPINRPQQVAPPQADFRVSGQLMVNQVISFDGTASTGQVPIVSWAWDFGDGYKATGPFVDHVYIYPGNYAVQLIVTDQLGYQDSQVKQGVISQPAPIPTPTLIPEPTETPQPTDMPQPTATIPPTPVPVIPPQAVIQGPAQGYVGEPVTFDASASSVGSSPIVSYAWNFGDGASAGPSNQPSQTTIYNQAGSFQVSVVVTDQGGLSSSATMEVTISAKVTTPVEWQLDQLGNEPVPPGVTITLLLQQGQLSGFSGCNNYNGAYTAVPNPDGTYSVTVTGLTSQQMICPDDVMQREQTYLSLLSTVTGAQSQGVTLILTSPQGNLSYIQAVSPK